jgi:bifunctional non-homologous end joining protein LigD
VHDAPPFVRTVPIESEAGRVIDYAVAENAATLLYLVNLGSIALHPWHSRVAHLDRPDWIVFDLDPEGTNYDVVCKVALALREVLERLGLEGYPKTSGSTGMHVYVPIGAQYGYDVAAEVAEEIAMVAARENPDLITLERSLANRKAGRVYLDYQQNARGKSVVAPYSVRARPRATVSAPLDWGEVRRGLQPNTFTMPTMRRRLEAKGDLFSAVLGPGQALETARAELNRLLRGRKRSHAALA